MKTLFNYRKQLMDILVDHLEFSKNISMGTEELKGIIANLKQGELSIAVVGEINRGKSTFLNALIGARVFPSRASVCTAGVSILDSGDPRAEVYFKNGRVKKIDLAGKTLIDELETLISRKNINVQNINMVRIWYKNEFTGNGVLIVDTPGVNDPEVWREEITYSYLANADAVIMLFDAMQPISASEVEFLENKILGQSIANLIFIVNRIDEVSIEDRRIAMNRIEEKLSQFVPNPLLYAVASKPALHAKLTNDDSKLNTTGFPEFERGLLGFLEKGRGGMLLKSKIRKCLDQLTSIDKSLAQRIGALNSDKRAVLSKLENAQKSLKTFITRKNSIEKKIKGKESNIRQNLSRQINERMQYLNLSLKPAIQDEPDIQILKNNVQIFQRDSIQSFRDAVQNEFDSLIDDFGGTSLRLGNEVKDVLNNLSSTVANSVNTLKIQHEIVPVDTALEAKKAGAAIGGGLGAVAGATIASSLTATTITATGTLATTAAFSTAGIVGVSILTGGLGLLLGIGAALLMENNSTEKKPAYINSNEMVNNQRALLAVDRFINNLKNAGQRMSKILIQTALNEITEPINREIKLQKVVMNQIQNDLDKTVKDQASIRKLLKDRLECSNSLRDKYNSLLTEICQN